ncbi:Insulin-like growth factor binding protein, N-terminal [Pseudocohnilembus persalinus]|uniref:Insulin-like growth factor binding protein, N-terminal n=1 Tax=Pseudocohnilembus persalinus TaxID=266149 RepID=A0A0V0QNV1_PSEPJ|nr:Insulin-like growth factor binding protein, N-terminal [Pseudocohnilembus persalinus]|eukprot:KRX03777.1 Insulin-like growth factor binding protein, N-terminal [Pseudocohnilembus persalinus]
MYGVNGDIARACLIQCKSCQYYENKCIECSGQNRRSPDAYCQCLPGYYDLAGEKQDCIQCEKSCRTCDSSTGKCLSCYSGNHFQYNYEYGTCECMEGYVYDKKLIKCQPCFKWKGVCQTECPENTYQDYQNHICVEKTGYYMGSIKRNQLYAFIFILVFIFLGLIGYAVYLYYTYKDDDFDTFVGFFNKNDDDKCLTLNDQVELVVQNGIEFNFDEELKPNQITQGEFKKNKFFIFGNEINSNTTREGAQTDKDKDNILQQIIQQQKQNQQLNDKLNNFDSQQLNLKDNESTILQQYEKAINKQNSQYTNNDEEFQTTLQNNQSEYPINQSLKNSDFMDIDSDLNLKKNLKK